MEKEFVPYEESLELKELGFDKSCLAIYTHNNEMYKAGTFFLHHPHPFTIEELTPIVQDVRESSVYILAPTFSQAFRWFREKYNISYSIDWMSREIGYYSGYIVHFRGINGKSLNQENFIVLNDELRSGYGVYKTYEEAELACLKKLIEINKSYGNNNCRS